MTCEPVALRSSNVRPEDGPREPRTRFSDSRWTKWTQLLLRRRQQKPRFKWIMRKYVLCTSARISRIQHNDENHVKYNIKSFSRIRLIRLVHFVCSGAHSFGGNNFFFVVGVAFCWPVALLFCCFFINPFAEILLSMRPEPTSSTSVL